MPAGIDILPQVRGVSEPLPAAQNLPVVEVLNQVAGLVQAGKYDEVMALLQGAMTNHPINGDLLNAVGYVYWAMGRQAEALKWYRDALEFNPNSAGIWSNLATAYKQMKWFDAAITCHRRAIAFSPDEAYLHNNLGLCLAEAGRHGEAVIAFNKTLALQPDFHIARWDRARSFLHLGNYRQGWADYEVRLITGQIPIRSLPSRKWTGTAYAGGRLLLLAEQGFGDTLWVMRYLPRVKALGGELIIECQPALCSLIASLGIADQVIPQGAPLPEADYHAHLCSLPGLFDPDLALLAAPPRLSAPPDRESKFAPYLQAAGDRLKVGIVWSGSVSFGKNADRALSLQRLLQAVDLPGVQLYSLQKGTPERELSTLPPGRRPIIDLSPELQDFADTAAVVAKLDLVIMTDSAVAHLAGNLGTPVWILLGNSAHWLWLLDRTDSPWYPSARLFRPRVEGDWNYVLSNMSVDLIKLSIESLV